MKRRVPTVLILPNTLMREGLARLLSATDYKPVRCVSCVEELMQPPALDPEAGVFIIGWDVCARSTTADAPMLEVRKLREQFPDACLVVVSGTCSVDDVSATLRAGANGYLLDSIKGDALVKSLDLIVSGETVLPSEFTRALYDWRSPLLKIAAPLAASKPTEGSPSEGANGSHNANGTHAPHRANGPADMRALSARETAILSRLVLGDSNKNIARGIGVAEATVKTHIKAILRKIGAKNRTQAALWAFTNLGHPLEVSPKVSLQNGSLKYAKVGAE